MPAILDISGLTKVFPARHGRAPVHALKHINLMLDEGDFIAVMGPSGCGKSTLLNIVAGFDRQDDGTCLVRDRPVSGPGPDRGMVFQEYALFPWMTVERNMIFAMRAAGKYNAEAPARIQATLERMGLWQFRQSYPKHLSGGMRQRLAIARILAIDSPMMLMDEPFGALDALTRAVLQANLVELWQETRKTVLFITHSVDEALFLAERVIVMTPRPGTIVLDRRIDLKRPRDVTTPEFNDLKREILTMISPSLHVPGLHADESVI
ncbi:ABC transporter ATP-binding protein [Acidisphaera sp. S103]|uniref:ABC transporter ATP-binding protein n=1 Tax=Acidisphaera sp. S103 TaxID=1747223 RepID=UPI00131DEF30|nr:ABC transporter ATP-binding protein [Acidisphaera sp. S103]